MEEVPLGGARHWVEFPDPQASGRDPDVVVRADLTWLTSRWTCIFAAGCPGVRADQPDDGCCAWGAHYSDEADRARTERMATKLTERQWQHRGQGRAGGVIEDDGDGALRTRIVDGACIFLNRPGFPGGAGCALHLLAAEQGVPVTQTKPDVCWQLPIRRSFEELQRPDGTTAHIVVLAEYDRRGWGSGGHDLDWFCTGAPRAHVGSRPVYESARDELIALIGGTAYEVLREHCRARESALAQLAGAGLPIVGLAPHAADPQPAAGVRRPLTTAHDSGTRAKARGPQTGR